MNALEIIEAIKQDYTDRNFGELPNNQQIKYALQDGDVLQFLGLSDDDVGAIEEAHAIVSE